MTYSPYDPRYYSDVPPEYRQCMKCDSKKKSNLRRSMKCCHILCSNCLQSRPSEGFICDKCGIQLTKKDFTFYEKDDYAPENSRGKEKISNLFLEYTRLNYSPSAEFHDILEKVQRLNELNELNPQGNEEITALGKEVKEFMLRKNKENQKDPIEPSYTIKQAEEHTKKQPKQANAQPMIADVVSHNQVHENVIERHRRTDVDVEIQRVCGYSEAFPQQKNLFRAFHWF